MKFNSLMVLCSIFLYLFLYQGTAFCIHTLHTQRTNTSSPTSMLLLTHELLSFYSKTTPSPSSGNTPRPTNKPPHTPKSLLVSTEALGLYNQTPSPSSGSMPKTGQSSPLAQTPKPLFVSKKQKDKVLATYPKITTESIKENEKIIDHLIIKYSICAAQQKSYAHD